MTQEERIIAINNSQITGEKKSIKYRNDNSPREVKRIPLKYLLYNPHNGRIRSYTKSFEQQFHKLDPTKEDDKLIIEQYLYDSAKSKNEKTLESLELKGQQEVGIVTNDGVIIDGNRRAMLLNIIDKEGFFNAIVLPDNLADNEKEIVTLETSYQMGVDSKVEYNPIEKYIRCNELLNQHKYNTAEIADIMAEEEAKIISWLDVLKVMEDYLKHWNWEGIYTQLNLREGHFQDLNGYLKNYHKRERTNYIWPFNEDDINKLKACYFSYIRLGIPVIRARIIGKPSRNNSFFCQREIWDEFTREHSEIIENIIEAPYQEKKENNKLVSNEDAIRELDIIWKDKVGPPLLENLTYFEGILRDKLEITKPAKILKRVFNSLGQIDEESLVRSDKTECNQLLIAIEQKSKSLLSIISQ